MLTRGVADRTTGWCPCESAGMTGNTCRLFMRTRERKCGRIVVKNIVNGTRWVTGQAFTGSLYEYPVIP
jgi:hypothetical protein